MRHATLVRKTKETAIELTLGLDGTGQAHIRTPLPFLTHMLEAFARHSHCDLTVEASGDIEVDAHHTVEDIGLVLGDAVRQALGDHAGISRFGSATLPMDDTLVTCAVDFCGRPYFIYKVAGLERKRVGTFDCELAKEFFHAFATRAQCNLHLILHHGDNAHHIIESCFKSLARATRMATRPDAALQGAVPSTKGALGV